jgi:hypothetical protein
MNPKIERPGLQRDLRQSFSNTAKLWLTSCASRGTTPTRGNSSLNDRNHAFNKSRRMTTHYSEAELANLIAAAERACDSKFRKTPRKLMGYDRHRNGS